MGSPRQGAQAPWRLQQHGHPARMLPEQRLAEHRSGARNGRQAAQAVLRASCDSEIFPCSVD